MAIYIYIATNISEDIPNLFFILAYVFFLIIWVVTFKINTLCFGNIGLHNTAAADLKYFCPFKAYKSIQKSIQSHNQKIKQTGFSEG